MSRRNPLPPDTEMTTAEPAADIGLSLPVAAAIPVAPTAAPMTAESLSNAAARPPLTREAFLAKYKLPPGSFLPKVFQTPQERRESVDRPPPAVGRLA